MTDGLWLALSLCEQGFEIPLASIATCESQVHFEESRGHGEHVGIRARKTQGLVVMGLKEKLIVYIFIVINITRTLCTLTIQSIRFFIGAKRFQNMIP